MSRLALSLSLCVALVLSPALALGQGKVPVRPVLVAWSGHMPLLSFDTRDFITRDVEKKLKSGLPQRIVTRVYAYRDKGERPITAAVSSCRVVYDRWEAGFRVQRATAARDQSHLARSVRQVGDLCLDVKKLALGGPATFDRHRGKRIYFAALVELNPLSPDTVQRIRRWLSRSGGDELQGDAFFGSFVSIFVSRRMGSAERTMTFRSRTLNVPR